MTLRDKTSLSSASGIVAPRSSQEHELKTWPNYFERLLDGSKTFEYRRDDRGGFAVGDRLRLREWNPETETYTGREMTRAVTYVLEAGAFAVLALAAVDPAQGWQAKPEHFESGNCPHCGAWVNFAQEAAIEALPPVPVRASEKEKTPK